MMNHMRLYLPSQETSLWLHPAVSRTSKMTCQKTCMGGEYIWGQLFFLLWVFLFNNVSALTASLVVHMAFSLAPSHWALCTPFIQTWLSVWNLSKSSKQGKLLRTGYSPAITFKVTWFCLGQSDKHYSSPYLSHLTFWFMVKFFLLSHFVFVSLLYFLFPAMLLTVSIVSDIFLLMVTRLFCPPLNNLCFIRLILAGVEHSLSETFISTKWLKTVTISK